MIFNIDESAAPQTTNIDGRAIWKRCTHSDIAWGLVKAFSSQIVVWTKYVCTISGAHVLKRALRKLSPRSFRQDFFSHKLVIALDCTQKKKRFNFLFSSFPHQPPFNFSSTVSNCPNLVMYICRPNLKYENITWLKWSVFVGIHSIHSSCTYFLTNINISDKHQHCHSDQYRQQCPDCRPHILSRYGIHSLLRPLKFVTVNYNRENLGRKKSR